MDISRSNLIQKSLVILQVQTWTRLGQRGSLVVSVLAFYSDAPRSNPAGYFNYLYEKTNKNKKVAGVGPSLKKHGLA